MNNVDKMQDMLKFAIAGLVSVMFLQQSAFAQSASDRFSIYYQHLGESNDVTTSTTSARVGHQMFLDEEGSSLLTLGVNYTETVFSDETLSGPDSARRLMTIVPEARLMQVMTEKYSLIAIARPGLYGDLKGSLGNDFRFEGGAVVTRYMTDSLTMGLGVGRGTGFGRDLVVPLLQFLYFASDKILVRGILPSRASIWYIPNQKWEFGGTFALTGALYKVENTNVPEMDKLGFAAMNLGLVARRNIFEKSFAVFELGYAMSRRYEWTDRQGTSTDFNQEPDVERELDNVPYVRVGWQHRL